MSKLQPVMNSDQLSAFIRKVFPQSIAEYPSMEVLDIQPGHVLILLETDNRHLRPGGTVSGPTLFGMADIGGYFCVLSHIGPEALAVTTNININFMRKAGPGVLKGDCRILKLGKRLMVYEIAISQGDADNIIAHATGTYAIPPKS